MRGITFVEGPLQRRYRELCERDQPTCALCNAACTRSDLHMASVHPHLGPPRWVSLCPLCGGHLAAVLYPRSQADWRAIVRPPTSIDTAEEQD